MGDIYTKSLRRKFKAHKSPIYALCFTRDGKHIFSGGKDRVIKCWRVEDGKLLLALDGHSDSIYCLAVSEDGRKLYSGSRDHQIKVWHLEDGSCLYTSQVQTFAENRFNIFEANNTTEISDRYGVAALNGMVYGLMLGKNGEKVYSGEGRGTITEWNPETGKVLQTFTGHLGPVGVIVPSPDYRFLYSGSGDCTIKIWPVFENKKQTAIGTMEGHAGAVLALKLKEDGRRLFSASADLSVKAWMITFIAPGEVRGGQCLFTIKGHCSNQVRSLALLATGNVENDGGVIFSAGEDNQVKCWGAQAGNWITSLRGHNDWVNALQLSDDGEMLVSAGHDCCICFWHVPDIIDRNQAYKGVKWG